MCPLNVNALPLSVQTLQLMYFYLARLGIDAVVTMDPSIDVCVTCFRSLSRSVRSCKNAGGAHFRGQVNEGKV